MKYYFSTKIKGLSFEETEKILAEELAKEAFGILNEIDVTATFKKKLDIDFRKYRIYGACNPHFAYDAIQTEDKIGVFLPCSFVLQEWENGELELSVMNPLLAMQSVPNPNMESLAKEVTEKLELVIRRIGKY
jgi:uncharacterized protein (DUF302 family)